VFVAVAGSSFLMVPRVHGSASFCCGRSPGMFDVSISAVFALPRGEVLTGVLVLGSDCSCMLFDS